MDFTRSLSHLVKFWKFRTTSRLPSTIVDTIFPIFDILGSSRLEDGPDIQDDTQGAAGATLVVFPQIPDGFVAWFPYLCLTHDDPVSRVCQINVRSRNASTDAVIAQSETALAADVNIFINRPIFVPHGFAISTIVVGLAALQHQRIRRIGWYLPYGEVPPNA